MLMQCSSGIDRNFYINQHQTASTASFLDKPGHKLVLKFSSVNFMIIVFCLGLHATTTKFMKICVYHILSK